MQSSFPSLITAYFSVLDLFHCHPPCLMFACKLNLSAMTTGREDSDKKGRKDRKMMNVQPNHPINGKVSMMILILGPRRQLSLFAHDLEMIAVLMETLTTEIEEIDEKKEQKDSSNTSSPTINGLVPLSPALLDVRPWYPVNISCRENKVQWQKKKERRYESTETFYAFLTFFFFLLFLFLLKGLMCIWGYSRLPEIGICLVGARKQKRRKEANLGFIGVLIFFFLFEFS